MLSIAEALGQVLSLAPCPLGAVWLGLEEALGRVVAAPILSRRRLPPFDNSAMDGYAVRAADLVAGGRLRLVGEAPAGSDGSLRIAAGEAARIFTGAPLPRGADSVVMQEHCEAGEGAVGLQEGRGPVKPGQHVRRAGSDVEDGSRLLAPGAVVEAGEIGLLAACGRAQLQVWRRPRVAIISTGDELVALDEPPLAGQIVNSNSPALAAMVRAAGGEPCRFPVVPDDPAAHRAAFERAAGFDVVLTSGGVSVGDHDHVQASLDELGWQRLFWKVAMKPGKPLLCGRLKSGAVVLGLPGNPASSMVAFELFGRPLLRRLQGHPRPFRASCVRALAAAVKKRAGRSHVLRGRVVDGAFDALDEQGSGHLRSMVGAEALAVLPAATTELAVGASVLCLDLLHDGASAPPQFS